jgi:predicted DNA repair protein MutK
VIVLVDIGILMTVGVYGIVAAIVKMDDLGLHLAAKRNAAAQAIGRGLLLAAPKLMKTLAVVGTAAMFLVGGGILIHGLPALAHPVEHWADSLGWIGALIPTLANMFAGIVAGALALGGFEVGKRLAGKQA